MKNRFSPNYKPPFDTGKVRIGLAYAKPQPNHVDTEEAVFWQRVLLGQRREILSVGPIPMRWYVTGVAVVWGCLMWITK